MEEVMRITEMEETFADEWVLIGDPEHDEELSVKSGKVLFHSKDRDEVYRQIPQLDPDEFAILYLGDVPEDVAIIV